MGAKTTPTKEKRPLTCETCQKEFQNLQALKSHTLAKHSEDKDVQKSSANETVEEKKTALVPPTARASKRLQLKKSIERITVLDTKPIRTPMRTSTVAAKKIMFECPKCFKMYNVYFSAYKHLQKRHCVDIDGNPVSPDSPDLIKPIRKETCTVCNKLVHGEHFCGDTSVNETDDVSEVGGESYICLGCKSNFKSVDAFDNHITETHSDDVDTMFFESHDEFLLWKCNMESQVKVKYQSFSNTPPKKFYHCNYVSPKNSADITHLCPSVLIAKELSKGIQIQYHKKHYEHSCEYKIPKQFEDYIVTGDSENDVFNTLLEDKNDEDDLYVKFRSLLKSIIFGASRINVEALEKLYNTALEMQTSLNRYDEDHEYDDDSTIKMHSHPIAQDEIAIKSSIVDEDVEDIKITETEKDKETNKKSINDEQITKALETRASGRLKRKSISNTDTITDGKKKKLSPNTNKIKSDVKENVVKKELKLVSPKVTSKTPPFSQSPSFNDTYKEFIHSAFKVTKDTPNKKGKKEVVKTRIGQFTPSPKKASQIKIISDDIVKIKRKDQKLGKTNMIVVSEDVKTRRRELKSPQINTIAAVDVVKTRKKESPQNTTFEVVTANTKRKDTKLSRTSLTDIEYEVVEQENDCNILVLKI